jgi:hypothetical protein
VSNKTKLDVPPSIHILFWLLANNKVLTRDSLAKRKQLDDKTCLFCKDAESVNHLFFECCVARLMWGHVAEITGLPIVNDFISFGKFCVMWQNLADMNVLSSAVLWTLWKTRNNLCFQGMCWTKLETPGQVCKPS